MKYKVRLTEDTMVESYHNVTSYEIWKEDPDYFIFFWSNNNTEIIIKKECVISVLKYKD